MDALAYDRLFDGFQRRICSSSKEIAYRWAYLIL
jgi:hypothetical protein